MGPTPIHPPAEGHSLRHRARACVGGARGRRLWGASQRLACADCARSAPATAAPVRLSPPADNRLLQHLPTELRSRMESARPSLIEASADGDRGKTPALNLLRQGFTFSNPHDARSTDRAL